MESLVTLVVGLMVGLLAAWVVAIVRRRAAAEASEAAFGEAQATLGAHFASLGAEALRHNNEGFLQLAEQRFGRLLDAQQQGSAQQHDAMEKALAPIHALVKDHQEAVHTIEKSRLSAYTELRTQVQHMSTAHHELHGATSKLVSALRRPEQRGRWGEMHLKRVVELAGMTEHCDFDTQVSVAGDDGTLRPDMVVHMAGGGQIIVDSKVALDAYLDANDPDADVATCITRHARQLRTHVQQLADKAYWKSFERTPEMVVMYVPLESALSAAFDADPGLHAYALERRVMLATPMLLVPLLQSTAFGWRQEDVAENARHIAEVGRKLHERIGTFIGHFDKLGRSLKTANTAYNAAVGSLETRVLVTTRELRELGATADASHEAPDALEVTTRGVEADVPVYPHDEPLHAE